LFSKKTENKKQKNEKKKNAKSQVNEKLMEQIIIFARIC